MHDTIASYLRTSVYNTDPADIDATRAAAALAAHYKRFAGAPAAGHWVLLADSTMHRIARITNGFAVFGDVLTKEGDLEGNFYLSDNGEMVYYGDTRRRGSVFAAGLGRTPVVAPTWVWRHHHHTFEVVNIALNMPVWQSRKTSEMFA